MSFTTQKTRIRERIGNEIVALEQFIENIYWNESLTDAQSKENLEKNIIELRTSVSHAANGLLITQDGYFITASHCLDHVSETYALTQSGKRYEIEKVCIKGKAHDVGLAKININAQPSPIQFKYYNTNTLTSEICACIGVWDSKLKINPGTTRSKTTIARTQNVNYTDHFSTTIKAVQGDSGSIIVSADGRLMGLLSTSILKEDYYIYNSTASKMMHILEMIQIYVNHLKKKNNY